MNYFDTKDFQKIARQKTSKKSQNDEFAFINVGISGEFKRFLRQIRMTYYFADFLVNF